MRGLFAFIAGLLFGAGLILGGMTQPARVIGFLDFFGHWDPSLAFVMGGAILIHLPFMHFLERRSAPLFAASFSPPIDQEIDRGLIIGAAIFGVGWGLAGWCPGPAITSAIGGGRALLFVFAMALGIAATRLVRRRPVL